MLAPLHSGSTSKAICFPIHKSEPMPTILTPDESVMVSSREYRKHQSRYISTATFVQKPVHVCSWTVLKVLVAAAIESYLSCCGFLLAWQQSDCMALGVFCAVGRRLMLYWSCLQQAAFL